MPKATRTSTTKPRRAKPAAKFRAALGLPDTFDEDLTEATSLLARMERDHAADGERIRSLKGRLAVLRMRWAEQQARQMPPEPAMPPQLRVIGGTEA